MHHEELCLSPCYSRNRPSASCIISFCILCSSRLHDFYDGSQETQALWQGSAEASCSCTEKNTSCRQFIRWTDQSINQSALHPHFPYCMRTPSVASVVSTYSLRTPYAASVLPPRLEVRTLQCQPYCVRDVRTLTVLHPPPSAGNHVKLDVKLGHPPLNPYCIRLVSVLPTPILAKIDKNPYCLRTVMSALSTQPSAASVRRCDRGIREEGEDLASDR